MIEDTGTLQPAYAVFVQKGPDGARVVFARLMGLRACEHDVIFRRKEVESMPSAARRDERLLDTVAVPKDSRETQKLLAMPNVDRARMKKAEPGVDERRELVAKVTAYDVGGHRVSEGPIPVQSISAVVGVLDAFTEDTYWRKKQNVAVQE
jgi:hypothetical protein